MNAAEFKQAVAVAKSDVDLSAENIDHFWGFGLPDFEPVVASVNEVARLIRWQAGCFDGSWDSEALNEVRVAGRRKFVVTV